MVMFYLILCFIYVFIVTNPTTFQILSSVFFFSFDVMCFVHSSPLPCFLWSLFWVAVVSISCSLLLFFVFQDPRDHGNSVRVFPDAVLFLKPNQLSIEVRLKYLLVRCWQMIKSFTVQCIHCAISCISKLVVTQTCKKKFRTLLCCLVTETPKENIYL